MREQQFIERTLVQMTELVRRRHAQRTGMDVSTKSGASDLLTATDLEVQRTVMEAIAREFPGDRFVGEEEGYSDMPLDPNVRAWVLDPIDGTHNFVRDMLGAFGVSLAFAEGGKLRAGGIAFPVVGKTYLAVEGQGATCNGKKIGVSDITDMAAAKIECDFSKTNYRDTMLTMCDAIYRKAGQVRMHGSAVVSLCSVAGGDAEAYIAAGLSVWDFAAGVLIVEEAGGRVTRLDGAPVYPFENRKGMLLSNGVMHEELLSMIVPPG
jgi:myo-inositol-1(or 4)-monophosphatase